MMIVVLMMMYVEMANKMISLTYNHQGEALNMPYNQTVPNYNALVLQPTLPIIGISSVPSTYNI
jgi:hypothetical protein